MLMMRGLEGRDLDRTPSQYAPMVGCGNDCYMVHVRVFLENLTVAEIVKKCPFFFRSFHKIP
jgi:hypothetical protein